VTVFVAADDTFWTKIADRLDRSSVSLGYAECDSYHVQHRGMNAHSWRDPGQSDPFSFVHRF
jgi:hypothetical protein